MGKAAQIKIPFKPTSRNGEFSYFSEKLKAAGHSPIYKMHKYFARRPHNVFRALIEHYTDQGDVVLDCFGGGGVTLVEGLVTARKVIYSDVNPVAAFVAASQVTPINLAEYRRVTSDIHEVLSNFTTKYYSSKCRECNENARVRWTEQAYLVSCPHCDKVTSLANNGKATKNGKPVNGVYECSHCSENFKAVDVPRTDAELLGVRIRCDSCGFHETVSPNDSDKEIFEKSKKQFSSLIKKHKLWYPEDKIPSDWDRQHEDCLHRKGFEQFVDFYSKRNLFLTALLLKEVKNWKGKTSPELYRVLLFTFSAVLRFTNNLTFSTDSWMGGRPIAWAKHAFWIPNQFVEVNPIEYWEKRVTATISGMKNQQESIADSRECESWAELEADKGTHIVWNKSSANLDLPDNSVAMVLTDPPYGSNVQYGELCSFWSVWLRDEEFFEGNVLDLSQECVVHRKTKRLGDYKKGYKDYHDLMVAIFSESFRVLKPGAPLVFTFNNKDLRAWYAVIKAATEAGFELNPEGVVYQSPIDIYRDTAHQRFFGALRGDFIYSFRKPIEEKTAELIEINSIQTLVQSEVQHATELLSRREEGFSDEDLYIEVVKQLTPAFVHLSKSEEGFEKLADQLSCADLIAMASTLSNVTKENGRWFSTLKENAVNG